MAGHAQATQILTLVWLFVDHKSMAVAGDEEYDSSRRTLKLAA